MPTVVQTRHGITSRPTTMTCAVDGRNHLVTGQAAEVGLVAGQGQYSALCGHAVFAAALVVPPGPTCRDCETALHRLTITTTSRRRGLVARLLRRGLPRADSRSTTVGGHRAVRG